VGQGKPFNVMGFCTLSVGEDLTAHKEEKRGIESGSLDLCWVVTFSC